MSFYANDTWRSQAVPHLSTKHAQRHLTPVHHCGMPVDKNNVKMCFRLGQESHHKWTVVYRIGRTIPHRRMQVLRAFVPKVSPLLASSEIWSNRENYLSEQ